MKKILFVFIIYTLYAHAAFSQSRKSTDLMHEGIRLKDIVKIEKALSKGVSLNDGLLFAVRDDNYDFVKYFVDKGATPTLAITDAVRQNNINLVEYLLEHGAKFKDSEDMDVEAPVSYLPPDNKTSPLTFNNSKWIMKDEKNNSVLSIKQLTEKGYITTFKIKKIVAGNPSLLIAINKKNQRMIELLISHGFNPYTFCIIRQCNFIGPAGASGKSSILPFPAFLQRPIEYAITHNAETEIVRYLQKYDSTKNYRYNIGKVTCIYENNCDSILDLKTDEFGIIITKKSKNANIFGAKLFYSIDNSDFKEIKKIAFAETPSGNNKDQAESVRRYYYTEFGDYCRPKELVIKIDINAYGSFKDNRDGELYKTAKIGDQVVLAENFRYKVSNGCWEIEKGDNDFKKYGCLYTNDGAISAVPKGWHIPTIEEWDKLYKYLGGKEWDEYDLFFEINTDEGPAALLPGGGSGFDLCFAGVHSVFGMVTFGKTAMFRTSTTNWSFQVQGYIYSHYGYKTNDPAFKNAGTSLRLFQDK